MDTLLSADPVMDLDFGNLICLNCTVLMSVRL